MRMAWTQMAAVKAVRRGQSLDILWRSRRPPDGLNCDLWKKESQRWRDPTARLFALCYILAPGLPLAMETQRIRRRAATVLTECYPKSVSVALIQYPSILHKKIRVSFQVKSKKNFCKCLQNCCISLRNFKALVAVPKGTARLIIILPQRPHLVAFRWQNSILLSTERLCQQWNIFNHYTIWNKLSLLDNKSNVYFKLLT